MNTPTTESFAQETELRQLELGAQTRLRLRKSLVHVLRLVVLVVTLGGWELAGRMHWIDPFFFSMPSQIVDQIWVWLTDGTSQGPLWVQVLVTLEETALGFLIGAIGGVIAGIA